jgi:PAS domain S-box-containing protein
MSQTIELSSEEALLKWERLFENVSWGVFLFGSPGATMHAVNPAYARMHGYAVEELKGRPLADTLAPEMRLNLERRLKEADEKGHYIYDSVHLRKDGTTFPVLVDFCLSGCFSRPQLVV